MACQVIPRRLVIRRVRLRSGGPGPAWPVAISPLSYVSFSYARGSCIFGGLPSRPDTRRGSGRGPDLRQQDICEVCAVLFRPGLDVRVFLRLTGHDRCPEEARTTAAAGAGRADAQAGGARRDRAGRLPRRAAEERRPGLRRRATSHQGTTGRCLSRCSATCNDGRKRERKVNSLYACWSRPVPSSVVTSRSTSSGDAPLAGRSWPR